LAIRHAANAITKTLLPDWDASTFVPVPPSKTKGDSRHDPRLLEALKLVGPSLPSVSELVIQLENTQSREKGISPIRRATNWSLDLASLIAEPSHFVVFDDLLTGGSHFAAMKIVLARQFPDVPVSALFLARRVPQPLQDMSA
jgi:predicted amidophosphoribosyltransferase